MDEPSRIATLEAEVAELTATIARLAERMDGGRPARDTVAASTVAEELAPVDSVSSRRAMLKKVALVGAGAAAGAALLSSTPAAATDGSPVLIGNNQGATRITYLGNGAFGPTPGTLLTSEATMFWTDNRNSTLPSANGLRGDGKGPAGAGLWGNSDSGGIGVLAGGGIGVVTVGSRAAALLTPVGTPGPARTDAHGVGELVEDANGDLWLNVVAGSPGKWRKIAGPATAGSFHPISQIRVYDSRSPAPTPGKLASGAFRVVSVKDGRDPSSGNVTALDAIPAGATAVTGNITVTNTTGALGGFLTVMPGDATALVGSTINWFGPGQNIANSFIGKLDASRQLKVFAGGAPSPDTDFIIDITGFYL
jgi:hypothetical protein